MKRTKASGQSLSVWYTRQNEQRLGHLQDLRRLHPRPGVSRQGVSDFQLPTCDINVHIHTPGPCFLSLALPSLTKPATSLS